MVTSTLVERLDTTSDAEPPEAVTTPMTCPATPSPVDAVDDCVVLSRLSPSCTFWQANTTAPLDGHTLATSAPPTVTALVTPAVCPTKLEALLLPATSPDDTLESFEVLLASTEARPEETTPETWPPTASPLLSPPFWAVRAELSPPWTFVPVALLTSARAGPVPESTAMSTPTTRNALRPRRIVPPALIVTARTSVGIISHRGDRGQVSGGRLDAGLRQPRSCSPGL